MTAYYIIVSVCCPSTYATQNVAAGRSRPQNNINIQPRNAFVAVFGNKRSVKQNALQQQQQPTNHHQQQQHRKQTFCVFLICCLPYAKRHIWGCLQLQLLPVTCCCLGRNYISKPKMVKRARKLSHTRSSLLLLLLWRQKLNANFAW